MTEEFLWNEHLMNSGFAEVGFQTDIVVFSCHAAEVLIVVLAPIEKNEDGSKIFLGSHILF